MAFYKLPCCGYRLNQIDKWYINEKSNEMDSLAYIISTYENSKYCQLGSISNSCKYTDVSYMSKSV